MSRYQSLSYLEDLEKEELKNKRVLVRVDFNVPLDDDMKITDDTRIIAALDTIKYLISNNCAIILMSHLGRPKGKVVHKMRLDSVAKHLEGLLQKEVIKLDDCIGEEVQRKVLRLKSGEIILLENLRFHQEEKKNDPIFAKQLASLADIYVNDAFGAAHRAHASTTGIAAYLPSYAGFLMAKELKSLNKLLLDPERPFISIIGGAKVSDKIEVLEKLIEICDILLIGGGMAYTFLFAQGYEVGNSILEEEFIGSVKKIIKEAKQRNIEMILPEDVIVAKEFKEDAESFNVPIGNIEKNMIGMGIGNSTTKLFEQKIEAARTIFWNGPLGVFEMKQFAKNTNQIAAKIASLGNRVFSVVGGGDSIAAISQLNLKDKISHISTGGGASLEYISGKKLPGLEALKK
ncbi:MAG: phosphoglycerate kinase [bacterium]